MALWLVRSQPLPNHRLLVVAAVIQLLPLTAPLMLSTDAWSYLNAGRIGAIHGGNPYLDVPDAYPDDPTYPYINPSWTDDTTVYGPAFVASMEAVAGVSGDRLDVAIWVIKATSGAAMVALALLMTRLSRRPAFAVLFIGWNPVFAMQFAGAGHNDALVVGCLAIALGLGAVVRRMGAGTAWSLAVFMKWTPVILLPMQVLADRAHRRPSIAPWFLAASLALGGGATILFGGEWLGTLTPLVDHASSGELNSLAIWPRLGAWVPEAVLRAGPIAAFAAAYGVLLWQASKGRARHGLTMVLFLIASPFLFTWYVVIPAALAAIEDDVLALWLVLGLTAYTGLLYLGRVGSVFDVFGG